MTEDHDEIKDIRDIPEDEANELRELVHKVLDHQIDQIVVEAYKGHNKPLESSAFNALFQEIPQEDLEALHEEGLNTFLGDRDPCEVDQDEAIEYASKYVFVALCMHYPWLMSRRKGAP
jgi:hypothetical protein